MLLNKVFEFHKKLQEKMGKDLVYSIVLDDNMYILSISTHKSPDLKFSHDRPIQTCRFTEDDLKHSINIVVDEVVNMYKAVLVKIEDSDFDDLRIVGDKNEIN